MELTASNNINETSAATKAVLFTMSESKLGKRVEGIGYWNCYNNLDKIELVSMENDYAIIRGCNDYQCRSCKIVTNENGREYVLYSTKKSMVARLYLDECIKV